jgi:putative tricarboxylic transport membrane protein
LKKVNAGVWAGLVVLALALVFFVTSLPYDYTSEYGPGPALFPRWISGLLIVLAALYIGASWKAGHAPHEMPGAKEARNILFIVISMALFVLLLPILGFNACGTLFLFALLFRSYKWYASLAISAGVTAGLYALFAVLLDVRLPLNALGF